VVIVRHASNSWLRFLSENAQLLSGVAYFMDDDIPAAWRCRELPLDYRLRTSLRYRRISRALARICDRVWVSNEVLMQRYACWHPTLVQPLSPFQPREAAASGIRRWCYHGTRAHVAEMHWLKPVVKAVQQQVLDAEFEIMGSAAIRRLFRDIPRVNVLAPTSWQGYVAHCRGSEISVGVAPLLPSHFNAARTHVKVFDIAHCGAVGVYSRRAPYFPRLSNAGAVFVDDDQAAWSKQIAALLIDDRRRMELHSQSTAWIASQPVSPSLLELIGKH